MILNIMAGHDIGSLLHHLAFSLDRINDQILQERLGIGVSQLKILNVLINEPETTQKQIADKLVQTEASVSRQVKVMINKGLLSRRLNPKSRREQICTPTPLGVKMTREAIKALNIYHQPMFERLTPKQQEQFATVLKTMHEASCPTAKTGKCYL